MLVPAILFPSARVANLLHDNKTWSAAASPKKGAPPSPQTLARLLTDSSSLGELATICQTLPVTLAAALVLEMHMRGVKNNGKDNNNSSSASSSAVDGYSTYFGTGAGPVLDLLASSAAAAAAAVLASVPADELPKVLESMSSEPRAAATRFLPNYDGSSAPTSGNATEEGTVTTAGKAVIPPERPQSLNGSPAKEMEREISHTAAGKIVNAIQGTAPDSNNNGGRSSNGSSGKNKPALPPRRPRPKLQPAPSVDLVEVCLLFEGEVLLRMSPNPSLLRVLECNTSTHAHLYDEVFFFLQRPCLRCFLSLGSVYIRLTMRAILALTLSPGSPHV